MSDTPINGLSMEAASAGGIARVIRAGSSDMLGPEGARNAIDQMFKLCFEPELAKRLAEGTISPGFQLIIAQVLFSEDDTSRVRFNDEARLDALVVAPRAITAGETVMLDDLSIIRALELQKSELDHGHATLIRSPIGDRLFFNFRRGRDRAASFTDQAAEFLELGIFALGKGMTKAAIENLHTAAEKICLAHLILNTRPEAHGKTHKTIRTGINVYGRTGNVDPAFVKAFNAISLLRDDVRYSAASACPDPPANMCELIRFEIDGLRHHWRWRDGQLDILMANRPDVVLVSMSGQPLNPHLLPEAEKDR